MAPWHRAILTVLAWSAATLIVPFVGADGIDPERQAGQGDSRAGYDSRAFRTDSRRIPATAGERLELAALAARPPLGLPPLNDPPEAGLIDLGRRLFFDRRLSANGTLSCGMCHIPEQAFIQNELATPVGIEGRFVRRNAPALYNVAYRTRLFHDGRETALARQIWSPLTAANEMGNPSRESVLVRIAAEPAYRDAFLERFGTVPDESNLGTALAAYQRALLSADSPFDRWYFAGDSSAASLAARQGFLLFVDSGCARCHSFRNDHAHFTDDAAHRTGVEHASRVREASLPRRMQIAPGEVTPVSAGAAAPERNDDGLAEVTGRPEDRWRYRTPSLRNVALTAPYMHDGSLPTLAAVVEFYDAGAGSDPGRDPGLVPLGLTTEDRQALIAFLESLTGSNVDALAADARSVPIGEPSGSRGGDDP